MTEANLLSALVHILTGIFHVCSEEEPEAFSPDGLLHLFESPDSLYKLIHVLNATEVSRFYNQRFDLSRADLGGADLSRGDLRGAHLHGANLRGANLSQQQLDLAHVDETTLLPDGLSLPQESPKGTQHAVPSDSDV